MVVAIASRNGEKAVDIAMKVLRSGGSALDAVEEGVKSVEDDPEDTTVGYGGIPNLLGEVELDASIMDGATLQAGAVAGVKHFKNPISIARRVMERTPHVMLIGDGADLFAEIQGFQKTSLLTQRSKLEYDKLIQGKAKLYSEAYRNVHSSLIEWYQKYVVSRRESGTVNVIALDQSRSLATGVSTSGLAIKLPGRTGDSPIIGAGNYADNLAGAATCTGRGELAIRVCLAKCVVDLMRNGVEVQEACISGIRKILALRDPLGSIMNIIALDKNGQPGGASVAPNIVYYYQDDEMDRPQSRRSIQINP